MNSKGLLRTLRELRVLVLHPEDRDGEELVRQLRRIGCRTQTQWPPPARIDPAVDVVFLLMDRAMPPRDLLGDEAEPFALVGIIDYEDPAVLDQMIDADVRGVVTKPIRAFGILSTLVTARAAHRQATRMHQRLRKLEDTVRARREIERCVRILMDGQGLSETDAYRLLQQRAMEQRQSLGTVAASIVSAHAVFANLGLMRESSGESDGSRRLTRRAEK
ncbi:ANTAR domain-containing response regulator [Azospirillum sp. ST 5-10]|uniref:ANTAR domain-containing response regulator n=1 Tax=unclassified Azospirillum TaxID=2630922 RepID=UPI003F4A5F14